MSVTRGKIKPEYIWKLRRHFSYILSEIDARYLTPFLFSNKAIELIEKEDIDGTNKKSERNELLLKKLLNSESEEVYCLFIQALHETNYDHVVEKLQNTELTNDSTNASSYSWFEVLPDAVKDHVISDKDAVTIATKLGRGWEHLMYSLDISEIEMDRVKSQNSDDTLKITHLLIKWRQKSVQQASIKNLMSCLIDQEYMSAIKIDWEGLKKWVENLRVSLDKG